MLNIFCISCHLCRLSLFSFLDLKMLNLPNVCEILKAKIRLFLLRYNGIDLALIKRYHSFYFFYDCIEGGKDSPSMISLNSVYMSVLLSAGLSDCLSSCLLVLLFFCPYACLSIFMSVCLSVGMSILLTVRLSFYLSFKVLLKNTNVIFQE